MAAKHLSHLDLFDMLHGAAVLGGGGGGPMKEAVQYVDAALATGSPLLLQSPDNCPPKAMLCTAYRIGPIIPIKTADSGDDKHGVDAGAMQAIRLLERSEGKITGAVFPVEMGAVAVGIAFYAAAMLGIPVLDADPRGRSVPELTHSSFALAGVPPAPIALVNGVGESFLLQNVSDDVRAESVLRTLCQVSGDTLFGADHAFPVDQIGHTLIPGTPSRAMALGRHMRKAKENGTDVASALAKCGGGRILFSGVVRDFSLKNSGGFSIGSIEITGDGKFEGSHFRLDVKNENMAGWVDGVLTVTIPEIICLINREKSEALINSSHRVGMTVSVIVLPAPAPFLSQQGLQLFGPGYIGLDEPFKSAIC